MQAQVAVAVPRAGGAGDGHGRAAIGVAASCAQHSPGALRAQVAGSRGKSRGERLAPRPLKGRRVTCSGLRHPTANAYEIDSFGLTRPIRSTVVSNAGDVHMHTSGLVV